jgi:phospholipid-transporting ATPase
VIIKSELPNNSLYTFEAVLKMEGRNYPLSPQQLLLRGAQLRNTRWCYAIAVFTGHESKLMMNSSSTPYKSTKIDRMINSQIIFLFFFLVAMALVGSIGQYFVQKNGAFANNVLNPTNDFLLQSTPPNYAAKLFPNTLTYIILYNNLIPLSLIVTLEFVKFALGMFINNDLDMYYEENDTPATARTSSLVEELGQVDYLFSDKTGTLTRNIMEFKMCSIGGIPYAQTVPDDKRLHIDDQGKQQVCYSSF